MQETPRAPTDPVAAGHGIEALTGRVRIGWGPALRMAATIGGAAWLVTHLVLSPPGAPWILALLLYLGLRLVADFVTHLVRSHPMQATIGATANAASWAALPFGMHWVLADPGTAGFPLWVTGLMLLMAGLALGSRHETIRRNHPRTADWLGSIGLLIFAPGIALATTGLPLVAPWAVLLPIATGTLALVLAVVLRPRRHYEESGSTPGWRSWFVAHRFRFALAALLVITYLLVRHSLADTVLFLPLWEFMAAIALAGFLLWSLRAHLKTALLDDPVTSPHGRHTITVDRHSEEELDAWENAFAHYLDQGNPTELNRLVTRLEDDDQIPARRAFSGVLTQRPPRGVLLLHPLWPYLAQILTLGGLVYALHQYGGHLDPVVPDADVVLPLIALLVGLWTLQFNRHGGPWWIKTLTAYTSLALLPWLEVRWAGTGIPGPLTLLVSPLGIPVALVLLAQPLVHAWRARRPASSRYAYRGNDPARAVQALLRNTERTLLIRSIWSAAGAVLVFLAVAELSRVAPASAVLFPLYLLTALLLLVHPTVIAVGLRVDHRRLVRHADRETTIRREYVERAIQRLDEAYQSDPRHPRRSGSPRPAAPAP